MWPPTSADVARLLRIRGQQPDDATVLDQATNAAVADVQDWRSDLFTITPADPGGNVFYGTVMYAAHLYSNRVATTGVDPVTDMGGGPATFLPAIIQRMLGISAYSKPRVG